MKSYFILAILFSVFVLGFLFSPVYAHDYESIRESASYKNANAGNSCTDEVRYSMSLSGNSNAGTISGIWSPDPYSYGLWGWFCFNILDDGTIKGKGVGNMDVRISDHTKNYCKEGSGDDSFEFYTVFDVSGKLELTGEISDNTTYPFHDAGIPVKKISINLQNSDPATHHLHLKCKDPSSLKIWSDSSPFNIYMEETNPGPEYFGDPVNDRSERQFLKNLTKDGVITLEIEVSLGEHPEDFIYFLQTPNDIIVVMQGESVVIPMTVSTYRGTPEPVTLQIMGPDLFELIGLERLQRTVIANPEATVQFEINIPPDIQSGRYYIDVQSSFEEDPLFTSSLLSSTSNFLIDVLLNLELREDDCKEKNGAEFLFDAEIELCRMAETDEECQIIYGPGWFWDENYRECKISFKDLLGDKDTQCKEKYGSTYYFDLLENQCLSGYVDPDVPGEPDGPGEPEPEVKLEPEPDDADGDGWDDYYDECPSTWGQYEGCPISPDDSDGDGWDDDEEDCPFTWGRYGGCPDSDGDGWYDYEDVCPNEWGYNNWEVNIRGCPDSDDEFFDTDGDNWYDWEDECPFNYGHNQSKGMLGCPRIYEDTLDSDGDGWPDGGGQDYGGQDLCPFEFGPDWNQGCPKNANTDGDGWLNWEDDCPNEWGSTAPSPMNIGPNAIYGCPETTTTYTTPTSEPTTPTYTTPTSEPVKPEPETYEYTAPTTPGPVITPVPLKFENEMEKCESIIGTDAATCYESVQSLFPNEPEPLYQLSKLGDKIGPTEAAKNYWKAMEITNEPYCKNCR